MDRFIDEQDSSSRDRSSSPNFYSLMFGGQSDGGRKGLSLYPGASSKSSFHLGESNGSAESVTNSSSNPPLTPSSATPLPSSQSMASPTNGGRFPQIGDEDRVNPSEQSANQ